MRSSWRRLVLLLVCGVVVFAAFSVYADVSELGDRLAGFAWWTFAAALGLALTNYAIRFFRWELYLRARGLEVPRGQSALTFVSGFALSVTPGKVGELLKSYLLREARGIPLSRSAPIVVAERITDLIALLILGTIGVALHGLAAELVVAAAAVVAVGLVALSWPPLAHAMIGALTRPRPLRRFGPRLREVYEGLAELSRLRMLWWATGLGAIAWLAECVGFALIVSGFSGAAVPLGLAIVIYAATTLAGAFSFLPGGLLVTEAGMTLLLSQASGVDQPTAVAATILTRLATLWFAVALGAVALALFRRRVPGVSKAIERERPAGEAE